VWFVCVLVLLLSTLKLRFGWQVIRPVAGGEILQLHCTAIESM
jgi:hypothetical protein